MKRQLLINITLLISILLSGCSANGSFMMKEKTYATEGIELRDYMESGATVNAPANYSHIPLISYLIESLKVPI